MKYRVFNHTDGIPAFPDEFATREDAEQAIEEFRARFSIQGYYLTASGLRIDPKDVELSVEES